MLKSPYYAAEQLWNQLDDSMKKCDCKYKFKGKVKLSDLGGIKTVR